MDEAERNVLDYQSNAPEPNPPLAKPTPTTRIRLPYEAGADLTPGDVASSFVVSFLIVLGVVVVLLFAIVHFLFPRLLFH